MDTNTDLSMRIRQPSRISCTDLQRILRCWGQAAWHSQLTSQEAFGRLWISHQDAVRGNVSQWESERGGGMSEEENQAR